MAKIMEVKVGVIKAPSVSVSFYNKGYFLFFFSLCLFKTVWLSANQIEDIFSCILNEYTDAS